jgi:hypothetical protein
VNPSHTNKVAEATEPEATYGRFNAKSLNALADGELLNRATTLRSIANACVERKGRSIPRVADANKVEVAFDRGIPAGSAAQACVETIRRWTKWIADAAEPGEAYDFLHAKLLNTLADDEVNRPNTHRGIAKPRVEV